MVMSKQKLLAQTKVGGSFIEKGTKVLLQARKRTNLTRANDPAESDQVAI
jgi:hypothetical protein